MKRQAIISIITVAMLCVSAFLTGCSGGGTPSPTQPSSPTQTAQTPSTLPSGAINTPFSPSPTGPDFSHIGAYSEFPAPIYLDATAVREPSDNKTYQVETISIKEFPSENQSIIVVDESGDEKTYLSDCFITTSAGFSIQRYDLSVKTVKVGTKVKTRILDVDGEGKILHESMFDQVAGEEIFQLEQSSEHYWVFHTSEDKIIINKKNIQQKIAIPFTYNIEKYSTQTTIHIYGHRALISKVVPTENMPKRKNYNIFELWDLEKGKVVQQAFQDERFPEGTRDITDVFLSDELLVVLYRDAADINVQWIDVLRLENLQREKTYLLPKDVKGEGSVKIKKLIGKELFYSLALEGIEGKWLHGVFNLDSEKNYSFKSDTSGSDEPPFFDSTFYEEVRSPNPDYGMDATTIFAELQGPNIRVINLFTQQVTIYTPVNSKEKRPIAVNERLSDGRLLIQYLEEDGSFSWALIVLNP